MIKYVVKVDDRGTKYWTLNGEFHREDGPAIEYRDGSNYWYLNGEQLTEAEHSFKTTKPTVEVQRNDYV